MCIYITVCSLYVYEVLYCNVCTLCTACSGGESCYAASCLIVLIVCTSDKTYILNFGVPFKVLKHIGLYGTYQ